jgi:hypothetical protein
MVSDVSVALDLHDSLCGCGLICGLVCHLSRVFALCILVHVFFQCKAHAFVAHFSVQLGLMNLWGCGRLWSTITGSGN